MTYNIICQPIFAKKIAALKKLNAAIFYIHIFKLKAPQSDPAIFITLLIK